MSQKGIEITPSVTVHALLEAYPELEEVLIGIAPPFKKLKNPFLRKSVAKVATIKHISSVGGVPLNELIGKLRKAVGQQESMDLHDDQDYFGDQPDWFSSDKISLSVDEDKVGLPSSREQRTLGKAKSLNSSQHSFRLRGSIS